VVVLLTRLTAGSALVQTFSTTLLAESSSWVVLDEAISQSYLLPNAGRFVAKALLLAQEGPGTTAPLSRLTENLDTRDRHTGRLEAGWRQAKPRCSLGMNLLREKLLCEQKRWYCF
jgi:hypothetical protein